jgi:hypothetical protein
MTNKLKETIRELMFGQAKELVDELFGELDRYTVSIHTDRANLEARIERLEKLQGLPASGLMDKHQIAAYTCYEVSYIERLLDERKINRASPKGRKIMCLKSDVDKFLNRPTLQGRRLRKVA